VSTFALAFLALLQEEPLERLIEKLGSESVVERDGADRALRRRVREALGSLEERLLGARTDAERARLHGVLETLAGGKVLPLATVKSARVTLPEGSRRLDETIEDLARQSGVRIVRDGGPAGGDPLLPELRLKDVPLDRALDHLARKAGGFWMIDGERIRLLVPGKVALRLFDVSDLSYGYADEPWLELEPDQEPPAAPAQAMQELTGEDLANLIRNSVEPDQWEEADGKSIQFQNGLLIVRNEPVILDRAERYLDELRRKFQTGIHVELEAYWCGAEARLGEDPLEELRKLAAEGASARRVASFDRFPRDKRRVALLSETTAHLVARYDGQGNPVFRAVPSGLRANLRASLASDGERVRVDLDARLSRLASVERRKTDRGEVQSPLLESHVLRAQETLVAGRSAVLARIRGAGPEGPLRDLVVAARFAPARYR